MLLEPVRFLFNDSINTYLQGFGNPFVDKFFLVITTMGSQYVNLLLASLIFWCFNKKTGVRLMYIVLFSAFLAIFAKNLIGLPRPPGYLHKIQESGFGFPSGHATTSTAFWAYLGSNIKTQKFIFVGAAVILLVSLSRVYLGVHYAGDVIGGIIFGALIALISLKTESGIASILQRLSSRSKYAIAVMLPLILMAVAIVQRSLLQDQIEIGLVMASIGVGYIVEEENIRLPDAKNNIQRIERALAGISILSITYLILSFLILLNPALMFFKYIALGLTTTFIAPLVFEKIEARFI